MFYKKFKMDIGCASHLIVTFDKVNSYAHQELFDGIKIKNVYLDIWNM